MSDASITAVKYCLLGFNIFGTFGNLNIIIATYKHKSLQNKCGLLLGFLACCDLLCLWYEMQSFVRITFGLTESSLRACFWANSGYIFVENLEVYVIVALAIDRQIAISMPIKYRLTRVKVYFLVLLAPGVIAGFLFLIVSYVNLTDITREICVLPYAMPDKVSAFWNYWNMGTAVATIIIYGLTYIKLYLFDAFKNDPNQLKTQKTILSTVIVQAIIFFFSSNLSALIIIAVRAVGWEDLAVDADTLAVIPGLLGYSCNFYVYYWRSAEYRRIFQRQIFFGYTLTRESQPFISTISITGGRMLR